jgi:hypothetical protein
MKILIFIICGVLLVSCSETKEADQIKEPNEVTNSSAIVEAQNIVSWDVKQPIQVISEEGDSILYILKYKINEDEIQHVSYSGPCDSVQRTIKDEFSYYRMFHPEGSFISEKFNYDTLSIGGKQATLVYLNDPYGFFELTVEDIDRKGYYFNLYGFNIDSSSVQILRDNLKGIKVNL